MVTRNGGKETVNMPHALRVILIAIVILIVIILVTVTVANSVFDRTSRREELDLLKTAPQSRDIVRRSDLENLPVCVQKWLEHSNVVGKEKIHTVRLKQTGMMRTTPDGAWMPMQAEQYFRVDQPGFVWTAQVKMAPLVSMAGRDHYLEGHGGMLIKLFSLIPVVNAKSGPEIDQGTLLRYLAEMQWFPTAALEDYIQWEEIDEHSARATMTYKGVTGSGVLTFNDQGDLVSFHAMRPREVNGKYVMTGWGGVGAEFNEFNGIRIPSKGDVIWNLETGDFDWFKYEITEIEYNKPELFH
jgi:hypothetical protein